MRCQLVLQILNLSRIGLLPESDKINRKTIYRTIVFVLEAVHMRDLTYGADLKSTAYRCIAAIKIKESYPNDRDIDCTN